MKHFIIGLIAFVATTSYSQDTLNGDEGEYISQTQMQDWIENFDANPIAVDYSYQARDGVDSVLSVQGIIGTLRYQGVDSNNKYRPIDIGVYSDGSVNLNIIYAGLSFPCPPLCLGEGSTGTPKDPKGSTPPPRP